MLNNISRLIICPYCHKGLILQKRLSSLSAIFSCQCNQYPLVEGILYMKKDKIRQKLINKITNGEKYLHLFAFSIRASLFLKFVDLRPMFSLFSFSKLINFIVLLGYPTKFAKYVLSRYRMPSFFLSLLSFDLIKPGITLDIGCGMGHLLPFIYKHCRPNNFIGLDRDFFNLCIAKKYFVKNNSILICCDVDEGLPIKNRSINNFFVIDTLHNIKNVSLFLKDLRNISKSNAEGAIIHTLNTQVHSPPPCYKRRPYDLIKIIKNNGFKNINILSSVNLWNQLNKSSKILLNKGEKINKVYAYNVLFTKRGILKFNDSYQELLKNTQINFYQDTYLTNCVDKLSEQ